MALSITVEHDGKRYPGEVMTAKRTTLGPHEHYGIFTADVEFSSDGSGVTVGGYCLDTPVGKDFRREGTAYGLDHIMRIIAVMGASSWEKIIGREAVVIYDAPVGVTSFWGKQAIGIASLDGKRVFIPKEHAEQWKERNND